MPGSLAGPSIFAEFLSLGLIFSGPNQAEALPNEPPFSRRAIALASSFGTFMQNFFDGQNDLEYSEHPRKLAGILAS